MRSKQLIKKTCEYCGKEFNASKRTVRYCSHYCNNKAYNASHRQKIISITESEVKQKNVQKAFSKISDRPYLSIAEAAQLLGVCRQTAYNLTHSGKIKATRVTQRMIFVLRESIDELLHTDSPYEVLHTHEIKPITDWYTLDEITERYGIKRHQIRKIVNSENIPETKDGTRTLIAKNKIDAYFKKRGHDRSIRNLAEWYTAADIMKVYNMTEQSVYLYVSRYAISQKQQDGKRYYSKQHIDKLKNKLPLYGK